MYLPIGLSLEEKESNENCKKHQKLNKGYIIPKFYVTLFSCYLPIFFLKSQQALVDTILFINMTVK